MNGIGGIYIHIIIQTGIGNRIAVLRLIGIDVEAQTRRILVLCRALLDLLILNRKQIQFVDGAREAFFRRNLQI